MCSAPDPYIFFQVSSKEAKEAYSFHQAISNSDDHIWPRSQPEIKEFCRDGELFGVKRASSGEYVGLCYVHLDDRKGEWEIGGLTISEALRGLRLGTVLTNFALAHTIANQRPWTYGQEIIAHVHEANEKARKRIERIGFEHVGTVTMPGEKAPVSMRRNSNGDVVGDKFRFPRENVPSLLAWIDKAFDGTVGDGTTKAIFEIRPGGLERIREALREAVEELKPKK